MRRNGFTLAEILVVMVIIALLAALLLPAIRKARSKAMMDKARAEMANLAGILALAKNDVGWYVRLCDLSDPILSSVPSPTSPPYQTSFDLNGQYTLAYTNGESDDTSVLSGLTQGTNWDEPYQVFQPNSIFSTTQGSVPSCEGNVTGWGTNPGDMPVVPYGTPLDPWGHPYLLAYNTTAKVMIIYSAGPDGVLQTAGGATVAGDCDGDGSVDYSVTDDLLYKFR